MYKKIVAIILSVIMILSCSSVAFAEDSDIYRIIYTQEFMDCVDEYVDRIGAWLMKDDMIFENTLPDGKVVLHYKGLQIYREDSNRVIFGLSDGWCTITEEVINGYVFTNPSFYGHHLKENKTGLCVYENGEIFSIREVVEKEMITADELAHIIPFTVKVNETTPPPTISTKPSNPTAPSTQATEPTEVTPLPTVVITPVEKPTEGQWETQPESTEITYMFDVETNQIEPMEEIVATEPEIKATEESVIEQQVKIKSNAKKVKFRKIRKAKQTVSDAITVENYQGKLKYKKVEKGSSRYLNINKKSGEITVKKGAKKGIHKIKVRITTKGNAGSKSLSKIIVVKIKVKK